MSKLIDKKTGATVTVTGNELIKKLKSGDYAPADSSITLKNEHGDSVSVDSSTASRQIQEGEFEGETAGEQSARAHEAELEAKYDDFGSGALAAGLGIARGATYNLSDVALGAIGDPDMINELRERRPGASLAGEAIGILGTAGVGSGGGLVGRLASKMPAGAGARFAAGVGARVGESTLARKVAGGAIEAGIDGALWSGGQSLAEATLNHDPLTVESFLANVGSGAAFGGAAGGLFRLGAAGVGKLAQRGEGRVGSEALKGYDDFAKNVGKRISDDLAVGASTWAKGKSAVEVADLVKVGKNGVSKLAPSELARKAPEAVIAELKKLDNYFEARAVEDTLRGTKSASDLIDVASLGVPKNTLDTIAKMEPEVMAKVLKTDVAKLPQNLSPPADLLWRAYVAERVAATNAGKSTLGALVDLGKTGANVATFGTAGLLDGAVKRVITRPIQEFATSLRAVQSVNERMAEGIQAFARASVKPGAAVKAQRVASSAFRGVRFAEGRRSRKNEDIALKTMRELQKAAADPMEMRRVVDQRLAPLKGINLQLGYELSNKFLERVAYLNRHLPPLHGPTNPFGLERGRPPAAEIQKFANRLRASEDPLSLLDDLKHGVVSREAVETVRELYPELFAQMQTGLMKEAALLKEKGKEMSYAARMQLDLLWDVPLEPTAQPQFMYAVNQMYAAKRQQAQQSSGGGFAPSAASPRSPSPTDAQKLGG